MLGIYESLPDDVINIIWNKTHNANMKTLSNEIRKKQLTFDYREKCLLITEMLIDDLGLWFTSTKNLKNILLLNWVKYFKLYKLIFGKILMENLFRIINSTNYIVTFFSNKKVTYNTKYSVPVDKKPLPYFCDKFIKMHGYKGKPIRTWTKAFEVLWNEL